MSQPQRQSLSKPLLAVFILSLLLIAAPVTMACVLCGGGMPRLLDGEFYGGG